MDNSTNFAELERQIRRMDIDADTIQVTYHLRRFAELFLSYIVDDRTLSDIFTHLNECALSDAKFAITMAAVFASRQLDDLEIGETKLRNAMLTILQQNFQAIELLKGSDVMKFYNSVTLLGEYYNRKKFANGKRILILGQSLLLLLTTELEKEIKRCEENTGYTIDPEFAKLILSQVTLNGGEAKVEHKQEVEDLNYSIRKCLINVGGMSSRTKAYLLMTLDLFHMNFNLDTKLLEKLYGKYLYGPDDDTAKDTKKSNVEHKCNERTQSFSEDKSVASSEAGEGSSKTRSKKNATKTDNAGKQTVKSTPPKMKKKATPLATKTEVKASSPSTTTTRSSPSTACKSSPSTSANQSSPSTSTKKSSPLTSRIKSSPLASVNRSPPSTSTSKTPPNAPAKKSPHNLNRKPPPSNHVPSRKASRPKPPSVRQSTPPPTASSARTDPVTPERSPLKTHPSYPNSSNTPEKSSVLKQNYKSSSKSSTSPASSTIGTSRNVNLKLPIASASAATHEDNVENLAWDDLTVQDESPQKINPHTKSFLSFLAQK